MSLSTKQREFTIMVANLILFASCEGMELTMGEAFRSQEQQDIHRAAGRSRVRYSKHQDRLAIDFNLFINGKYVLDKEMYRPLGEEWEKTGGRWGGRFGVARPNYKTQVGWDAGHFEYGG